MAIQRISRESLYYPSGSGAANEILLDDLPWMASYPKPITALTGLDMIRGLNSDKFRDRSIALRERWCGLLAEAFDGAIATNQQGLGERWTIHPNVDGCLPPPQYEPPR
jgi:hypothetical protein